MSTDNDTFRKRLKDNYPFAEDFTESVSIKFSEIYKQVKQVYPDSGLRKGETRDLTFHVRLDNKGDPKLILDQDSTILFVAIAESLLKSRYTGKDWKGSSLEESEQHFLQEDKICPNPDCGAINNITDQQCPHCGIQMN